MSRSILSGGARGVLRRIGRSRRSKVRAQSATDSQIRLEELKVERHALMLAIAATPLGSSIFALRTLSAIDSTLLKVLFTVGMIALIWSAVLRLALLVCARDRVFLLSEALNNNQESADLHFTSRGVENTSEFATLIGYGALIALVLTAVWQ